MAYWDAGDVIFQDRLQGLWDLVSEHPERLLVVEEPESHPENTAVADWTLSIRDPEARRRAFDLLSTRPFLNSGFAAGTAKTLLAYLREADRMLHSADLAGTADWGDQTALNLYCYSAPGRARGRSLKAGTTASTPGPGIASGSAPMAASPRPTGPRSPSSTATRSP